ncbi:hypothetical protein [Flagellimonas sp. HSM57]|uniref:hypothetical protein n=1 Tax=Flagellimonas sp. HSM57 TaxID=2654675 RepID=UPI0013D716D6|nr:hypothetical protein [Flagellimonas sp. HSM57]
MELLKGFVTICFIVSKLIETQTTHKQGLYGVNEKRNAAPARYPLASPFFSLVKIPSHLTKKSDAFLRNLHATLFYILMYTVIRKVKSKKVDNRT